MQPMTEEQIDNFCRRFVALCTDYNITFGFYVAFYKSDRGLQALQAKTHSPRMHISDMDAFLVGNSTFMAALNEMQKCPGAKVLASVSDLVAVVRNPKTETNNESGK